MINPKGSHYCGAKFLELFLDAIGENDFIYICTARVHREKGKIDLLIEDGKHYLLIENKLRAVDQKHQISRYISYIIQNYLCGNENIDKNIRIVYLSEYKKQPSIKSKSTVGFRLEDEFLVRECKKVSGLILPTLNSKIRFNRVKHSIELWNWVEQSKEYLKSKKNSEMLIYAFEEYELILQRLKSNNWRNIMSLDEYVLEMDRENEEKMYKFMEESAKVLNSYRAKKIYGAIDECILKKGKYLSEKNRLIKRDFTLDNCIAWFNRKGKKENRRDVGLIFEHSKEKYIFLLGVEYIYFHKYCDKLDKCKRYRRDEIFLIVDKIEKLCKCL